LIKVEDLEDAKEIGIRNTAYRENQEKSQLVEENSSTQRRETHVQASVCESEGRSLGLEAFRARDKAFAECK